MKTSWGYFTLFSHKFCTLLNSCIYCTLVSHVGVKCSQKKYYSYWCFFVSFPFIINQNICLSLFSFFLYLRMYVGKTEEFDRTCEVACREEKSRGAACVFSEQITKKKKKITGSTIISFFDHN